MRIYNILAIIFVAVLGFAIMPRLHAQDTPPATQAGTLWLRNDVHCPDGRLFMHGGDTGYWDAGELDNAYSATCGSNAAAPMQSSPMNQGAAVLGNALGQLAAAAMTCALFDKCPPGWRSQENSAARSTVVNAAATNRALVNDAFAAQAAADQNAASGLSTAMTEGSGALRPHDLSGTSPPSVLPQASASSSEIVGADLSADLPPAVPEVTAEDYLRRSSGFLIEKSKQAALDAGSKLALSGEMFAEEEMGPYGMTAVIMKNAAQLPDWEFQKILVVARGDLSPSEVDGLTLQAVNRLYDFNTSANAAISNGVLETAKDNLKGVVKSGVAQLASSFLPGDEAEKSQMASTALKLSGDLPKIISFWTTKPDSGD